MRTIWKFPIEITDTQEITAPEPAHVLSAGIGPGGEPCVWVEVDTDRPKVSRGIAVVGTGNPSPNANEARYVGSFVHRVDRPNSSVEFVWHIFDDEVG